jgi:AraC-like DNA-binding protein
MIGTTERTLRRNLAAASGAGSFRDLVDDARRMRAERLLKSRDSGRPGMESSITEIAFELGFSDASSFTHACRRWFGVPPSRCS